MSRFYDADGPDKRITTINGYLHVYPDTDPFGRPYDDIELEREMTRASLLAFEPATVADGSRGHGSPAPTPAPSASGALSPSGERSGSATHLDVNEPVAADDRLA